MLKGAVHQAGRNDEEEVEMIEKAEVDEDD